jgi:UDP-N-acetylmuramoylalanine--D-glutamate ligase
MTLLHLTDPSPDLHHFTLFGLGWSGVAAANLLILLGKSVTATDTRDEAALRASLAALEAQHGITLDPRVALRCGQPHRAVAGSDAVLLTQSVKPWDEPVLDAQRRGLPVIPEVELAAGALAGLAMPLITIGGTDGKTTTVKLAGHLASADRRAWIGGNSWTPLSARVMDAARELTERPLAPGERAAMIAEISAFQLPPWHRLRPSVAAVTNVAEDHVEEFFRGDFDAYVAAKRALTDRLGPGDLAVLNVDDPRVRAWEPAILARGARALRVSLSARPVADAPDAAFRHNGQLRLRWGGHERALLDQRDLPLLGDHNVENALTALGALAPLELPTDRLRDALRGFQAPHHRLERVGLLRGVEVFDDSKATNVHAALAGLSAFGARPLVVIAGGVDKQLALGAWADALRSRARAVVVIGQLRDRVARELPDLPGLQLAASLDEAVALAIDAARPGDALVLSPACSSFDMFEGYAQRGEAFQAIIRQQMLTEG